MKITPYLMFNGQAEEALKFYATVFDGTPGDLHRYSDFPSAPGMPPVPDEYKNRIGHTCITFSGGTIGLADTALPDKLEFGSGLMLTVVVSSVDEAEKVWSRLSDGAKTIACPLQKTFYAERYGELTDRFGLLWAVMTE